MGTGQRWGDIHVWSPEELREEDIYLGEMIRFAREYTEYSHERRPDELPKGTHRLEMCSMQEARGGWETRELPYYEVDSYLSRVRGVQFHPSNMPVRSAWGEAWFELVPEFHNKMDPFAVAVDFEGKRIGYLKASIAARFQWIVRAKNADGYRCFLPGFIESFYSAWISLPTAQTWESRFNLDTYYRIIRNLWDLLPKDFLEIEVKKIVEHPSEEAAKELWKFRDSASQFFPAESDASHFSIVWHQVFQEIRRDYWNAEHEKQESEAVKDLESLPTLAEKSIGKETANSRHFEQYYAKSILALQQKEAGASDDSLAELFEVPIEKIKQMLADGVFYQDPTQDNERLNLAKQAAVEHWSKNQAKEMGTDFVRAVTDRKILRHFHPEILQG